MHLVLVWPWPITSKCNQSIFVPKCTQAANLVKIPQVVYILQMNSLYIITDAHMHCVSWTARKQIQLVRPNYLHQMWLTKRHNYSSVQCTHTISGKKWNHSLNNSFNKRWDNISSDSHTALIKYFSLRDNAIFHYVTMTSEQWQLIK